MNINTYSMKVKRKNATPKRRRKHKKTEKLVFLQFLFVLDLPGVMHCVDVYNICIERITYLLPLCFVLPIILVFAMIELTNYYGANEFQNGRPNNSAHLRRIPDKANNEKNKMKCQN